jgi:hypothetical protein
LGLGGGGGGQGQGGQLLVGVGRGGLGDSWVIWVILGDSWVVWVILGCCRYWGYWGCFESVDAVNACLLWWVGLVVTGVASSGRVLLLLLLLGGMAVAVDWAWCQAAEAVAGASVDTHCHPAVVDGGGAGG